LALCALAAAISIARAPDAFAQQTTLNATRGDDLRAAFANAADIAEGKRVAETSCAGCHGAGGVSANKGVPHLAGQRPAYVYNELRQYQRGARSDAAMGSAVKFLNDDALVKVAAYYASLEAPVPSAPAATSSPAKADSMQAGKAATAACAGCHGDSGVSKIAGVPSLVGLDPKYLVAAMNGYKSGARKNDAMKAILSATSDSEIADVALFYAVQKATADANACGGRSSRGQGCGECLQRLPWQQRRVFRPSDTQPRRPGRPVSRGSASCI
jgi:cytochrome c553